MCEIVDEYCNICSQDTNTSVYNAGLRRADKGCIQFVQLAYNVHKVRATKKRDAALTDTVVLLMRQIKTIF